MAEVITISRPNFLYSEEGMVLKTYGVYDNSAFSVASETDADGLVRKIVKQGTVLVNASGITGIVFQDIDVTGSTATKQVPASIMVSGHYINSSKRISKVVASTDLTAFVAQGLIGHPEEATVVRPYGEETL